ncbi:MAG: S-methyl-5-thioribose-1-phosphate isomerase [Deltaproteobacteria bacterium]|nr:S-methyl-5-thioribose-1-phosphate isomerase [Deltaproteobacteria bacterium]
MNFKTIEWKNNKVVLIDQTKLPQEEVYVTCSTAAEVAEAIKTMVVRGAPAIGVAGAMGVALSALNIFANDFDTFFKKFSEDCEILRATRPTAVNLAWAIDRIKATLLNPPSPPFFKGGEEIKKAIVAEALKIHDEDIQTNRKIGQHGDKLIANGDRILTHCNAGALATAGYGTALGVLYAAKEQGKKFSVFADETRPFLQGSRLTAWELQKNGIPTTLISDNMAGWMMKKGEVTKVIVGADRIAANGDVANKIGTYSVAVLAKEHGIPFYVAAPLSTIDLKTPTGDQIPIEERSSAEVTHLQGIRIAPKGIPVRNPAFDVTPARLVSALITEKGIAEKPFEKSLKRLFEV